MGRVGYEILTSHVRLIPCHLSPVSPDFANSMPCPMIPVSIRSVQWHESGLEPPRCFFDATFQIYKLHELVTSANNQHGSIL
jgi:hypothetical protein